MQFLWRSQLKRERGRLLPKNSTLKKRVSRKEKLQSQASSHPSYFIVFFLWILFFGTLVYVVFFSPYVLITSTHIEGAPSDEARSIESFVYERLNGKYLHLFPKNDFFLVFPSQLEGALLSEYPLIRSVTVARVFPHTLSVKIEPRERLVLWCSEENCVHVHEDGSVSPTTAVFDRVLNQERSLRIHDLSKKPLPQNTKMFSEEFVPFVLSLHDTFSQRLGIEIEDDFSASSRFANEIRCKTKQGWEVYLHTERPLDESLNTLALLFDKEISTEQRARIRYIDLRTENRAYYAFVDGSLPNEVTVGTEEAKTQADTSKKEDKKDSKKKEKN